MIVTINVTHRRATWNCSEVESIEISICVYLIFYEFHFFLGGSFFLWFLSRFEKFSCFEKYFSTWKWHGFPSTSLDWHLKTKKFLRLEGTPIYGKREQLNVTLTIRWQPFNSDLLLPPISVISRQNSAFSNDKFHSKYFRFQTYRQIQRGK